MYLRTQWAWKPSNSETFFIEKSHAIAHDQALQRTLESAESVARTWEREQAKENGNAKKDNRPARLIPIGEPVTYRVLQRQISDWGRGDE